MLRKIIQRLVRKVGVVNLLLMIGDYATEKSPSKRDDEIWAEVKMLLDTFSEE